MKAIQRATNDLSSCRMPTTVGQDDAQELMIAIRWHVCRARGSVCCASEVDRGRIKRLGVSLILNSTNYVWCHNGDSELRCNKNGRFVTYGTTPLRVVIEDWVAQKRFACSAGNVTYRIYLRTSFVMIYVRLAYARL